jgi:hypothetical protein
VFPSELPGVNPATLNGMLLYYRLMTKWSGLGDSTELSRVGLSQLVSEATECTGVIRLILITRFTIKLVKIDWILKTRWIVKE